MYNTTWSVQLYNAIHLQVPDQSRFHCRVVYEDSVSAPLRGSQELEEKVEIYLKENYEQISVPVPDFSNTDPANIIHDFHRVKTHTSIILFPYHTLINFHSTSLSCVCLCTWMFRVWRHTMTSPWTSVTSLNSTPLWLCPHVTSGNFWSTSRYLFCVCKETFTWFSGISWCLQC